MNNPRPHGDPLDIHVERNNERRTVPLSTPIRNRRILPKPVAAAERLIA